MDINEVAIRQGVARFAAPPTAVPKRAPNLDRQIAPTPPSEAEPTARVTALQASPPAPAETSAPAAGIERVAAALEQARSSTEEAVESLEARRAENTRADIRVHVDEGTGRIVAEVLNQDREVIRQIPPEELLRIAARLEDVVGLLFDRRV